MSKKHNSKYSQQRVFFFFNYLHVTINNHGIIFVLFGLPIQQSTVTIYVCRITLFLSSDDTKLTVHETFFLLHNITLSSVSVYHVHQMSSILPTQFPFLSLYAMFEISQNLCLPY